MGKAIILPGSDYSAFNLGNVTKITSEILPYVTRISSATTFLVKRGGIPIENVTWSISDNTLASLVTNEDGTCLVTPLLHDNAINVILTAYVDGETLNTFFVPCLPQKVFNWYIDRCTDSPSSGSLNNANLANGGWAFMPQDNSLLQGKTINRVIIVPSKEGVINLYKSTVLTGTVILVASFTVTSAQVGVKTMYELTEFTLGENDILVIGQANSVGGFKYLGDPNPVHNGFYSKVPSSPTPSSPYTPGTNGGDLNFSIGYYGEP